MGDAVNHPPHYTSHPSGVECIQVTERGCTRHRGIRCDGSRIEWLDPAVCGLHRTEEIA